MGFLDALKNGLARTKETLNLGALLMRKPKLDAEFLEELESTLFQGDLGLEITDKLLEALRERIKRQEGMAETKAILQEELVKLFPPTKPIDFSHNPTVILLAGVNGCGKTTTAGKLAYNFARGGKKVVLAAADTFRAAAIEQLELWGQRAGVRVVRQSPGSDPASVAFDALQSAKSRGEEVVIIDTAGRLQSKSNLMNELEKITRVLKKIDDTAPHHTFLVLDAVIGQNALSQARVFTEKAGVDGLIITKLDGTAKGGAAIAASGEFNLPIYYIGVGEKAEDLLTFDPELFIKELLE